MPRIRAFVGHSFSPEDDAVVQEIIKFLKELEKSHDLDVVTAQRAEARQVSEKVISKLQDRNLLISICTRKELVIEEDDFSIVRLGIHKFTGRPKPLHWKTSDWLIQEIGFAKGMGKSLIILLEQGVRAPGALQADHEFITFSRNAPEKSFVQLLQQIQSLPYASVEGEATSVVQAAAALPSPEQVQQSSERAVQDWTLLDYDIEAYYAAAKGDKERFRELTTGFAETDHAQNPENAAYFAAKCAFYRLVYLGDGRIEDIFEIEKKFPQNGIFAETMADVYVHFGDERSAVHHLRRAADLSKPGWEKVNSLLSLLEVLSKLEDSPDVDAVIEEIRVEASTQNMGDAPLLKALSAVAKLKGGVELEIALSEAMLERDPSNTSYRDNLAYKYLELERNAAAIQHYINIPASIRSGSAWNNLGVAQSRAGLDIEAAKSYKKSISHGETLASSNLAARFKSIGLIDEARKVCAEAQEMKSYDPAIDRTLSSISEDEEKEQKKIAELKARAIKSIDFYRQAGSASIEVAPSYWAGTWRWPTGTVSLDVFGSDVAGVAFYNVDRTNSLISALGRGSPPPTRYELSIRARIVGRAAYGTLVRRNTSSAGTSLLSAFDEDPIAVLMVQVSVSELKVMEWPKGQEPRFYLVSKEN